MKECFIERKFQAKTMALIEKVNAIIGEYALLELVLTLRQLYYQLVSRDIVLNNLQSYNRVGEIVNDAKLAGFVDWAAIEDRRRNLMAVPHYDGPADAIESVAGGFALDKWEGQKYRPEVWSEKEALLSIIDRVAVENDLAYMACCGYNSGTEMYNAAQRVRARRALGQETVVIYCGDHDPSGLDMSESDIPTRFQTFLSKYGQDPVEIRRVALNLDQVEKYNPPPNFAKETDARYGAYRKKYGDKCWEVDALDPRTLIALIQAEVDDMKDAGLYTEMEAREADEREQLSKASDRWNEVARFLEEEEGAA